MTEQHDRIVNGARDLFFRLGMKSVTMDDICGQLGISKKTIYQFYSDKESLVYEVTSRVINFHEVEISTIRETSIDPIQEILATMDLMSRMMNKISPTVFYDLQKYYRNAWELFLDFKNKKMTMLVEDNFRRGIKDGLYREELNVGIMARLRIQEIEMGYNPDVFPPDAYNISEVQLNMMDHFLHGIVTLKGFELINTYKQQTKK